MKFRKLGAMLLALAMLVSICLSVVPSAGASTVTSKNGTFYYADGAEKDYSGKFYYKDSYFTKDADVFNQKLATMSLCFAMSAFASNRQNYTNQSQNAKDLLKACGFTGISVNSSFTQKPTRSSIGVIIGSKQITSGGKSCTLLALAVRGAGYEKEWASNFCIGSSGLHDGFEDAREQALQFLRQYIESNAITGRVKIWITGFSRAAATSNLLAAALNDGAVNSLVKLKKNDIYAYCFECPAGAPRNMTGDIADYNNIFNIINQTDLVTKVAPSALGFQRYGVDMFLPTKETTSGYSTHLNKMLKRYDALGKATGSYEVDNFMMRKFKIQLLPFRVGFLEDKKSSTGQGAFLDDVITKLVKEEFKTRSNYVKKFQSGIMDACGVFFGADSAQWESVKQGFLARLKENGAKILAATTKVGEMYFGKSATEMIADCLMSATKAEGLTTLSAKQVKQFAADIALIFLDFATSHPNLTATLVMNITGIGAAHYPVLCLAWMQSFDSNYATSASANYTNGCYRMLRVNSRNDVSVYNSDGAVVANVTDGELQTLDNGLSAMLNADDEVVIYVPMDENYRYAVSALEDGTASYAIKDFNTEKGDITRLVSYHDVVAEDRLLQGELPACEEQKPAVRMADHRLAYSMTENGKRVYATEDFFGESASNAYCFVDVCANDDTRGIVYGSGIRDYGGNAKLIAVAAPGYVFEGWYCGEQRVSTDAEYLFTVTEDTALEGRFVASEGETPAEKPAPSLYQDVDENAWYASAVHYVTENGLFMGTGENTFAPDTAMTRAMMATVLYRADGEQSVEAETSFSDVASDAYYHDAVVWAENNGIIEGVNETEFAPELAVTREQVAVLLHRYAAYRNAEICNGADLQSFADFESVSSYAESAMAWAVAEGLIEGTPNEGNKLLTPTENATRAQIAALLMRFMEQIVK